MCTKTNNHQNPNKNNRIRQSTIIQLQSDSSPLQRSGPQTLNHTRQIRNGRGRSRAFSGLGQPAGPNQRSPAQRPDRPRRHSANHPDLHAKTFKPPRDSSPLPAAGHKPSPRTRQIRNGRGRSRAFSGLGSLLDRTSAARRSAPTGPDATVQTQYRRYKKAPAAEGLFV